MGACFLLASLLGADVGAAEVSVATFNVWGAGSNDGKPTSETVAALRALNADILALQEIRSESDSCVAGECNPGGPDLAQGLAEALGYSVFIQTEQNEALWANAILSRYPIVSELPYDFGAIINVRGDEIAVLNVHLLDYPYQPYQLTRIDYGNAPFLDSEDAAIASAESTRGPAVDALLDVANNINVGLVVICGDFNEPSHLDWTEGAAEIGRNPLPVLWPASKKLEAAGFVDAYRSFRADEIESPGFTWTPSASPDDHLEHHDRIDFVYLRGHRKIMSAQVAGESERTADIVVKPWPSDHRAVKVKVYH